MMLFMGGALCDARDRESKTMTKAKRLSAAIKAEIATLKNDVTDLTNKQQQSGHAGEKAMYGQLLERAKTRLSLLISLK